VRVSCVTEKEDLCVCECAYILCVCERETEDLCACMCVYSVRVCVCSIHLFTAFSSAWLLHKYSMLGLSLGCRMTRRQRLLVQDGPC